MLPFYPDGGMATLNGFVSMDPETGLESFAKCRSRSLATSGWAGSQIADHPDKLHLREMSYDFTTASFRQLIFHCDDGDVGKIGHVLQPDPTEHRGPQSGASIDRDADIEITAGCGRRACPASGPTARCPTGQEGPLDC